MQSGPFLKREPDAVRGPIRVVPAVALVYLPLVLGTVPAAIVGLITAVSIRSIRGVLASLVVGILGFVLPIVPMVGIALLASAQGVAPEAIEGLGRVEWAAFFLTLRVLGIGLGILLFTQLRGAVRGHTFLGGRTIPLLWVVFPAYIFALAVPGSVRIALEAPLLALLFWGSA